MNNDIDNDYKSGDLLVCLQDKGYVGGMIIKGDQSIMVLDILYYLSGPDSPAGGPHKYDFFTGLFQNKKINFYRYEIAEVLYRPQGT